MPADLSNVIADLPAMPTVAELALAIRQAAERGIDGLVTNYNAGGIAETLVEVAAIALGVDADQIPGSTIQGAYALLQSAQDACFITTAKGPFLDLKCADVGVYRKPAAPATSQFVFRLDPPPGGDVDIPLGTIVGRPSSDPNGAPVSYATAQDATYPHGAAASPPVPITATRAGTGGNAQPGEIDLVLSGPAGMTGSNVVAAAGGLDDEDDDAPNGGLRARGLRAIPNGSCTPPAIEDAALAFAGIISAVLVENTSDDGVTAMLGRGQLYLDDGSGNLATNNPGLLAQIQAAFDARTGQRAAGTQVHVRGSVLAPVQIALSIYISSAFLAARTGTQASVIAAVQKANFDYVNAIPIGRAATLAAIVEAAGAVPGVTNVLLETVRINGNAADLVPAPAQSLRCASLDSIAVTVVAAPPAFFG